MLFNYLLFKILVNCMFCKRVVSFQVVYDCNGERFIIFDLQEWIWKKKGMIKNYGMCLIVDLKEIYGYVLMQYCNGVILQVKFNIIFYFNLIIYRIGQYMYIKDEY